ncbi:MAG: integration host factor subunit beta [Bacteroidales bacterium]|nr:integration host factor subunit beta [Bacteroidales bacterium]
MTKADIIARIVAETGIEKPTVTAIVESMMGTMEKSMIAGNEIFLRGFGSFILKKRAPKKARNISKGTIVNIPAHMIPAFKPCKEFVAEVKEKVTVK